MSGAAAASLALAAGIVAPGWVVVRGLGLGEGPLVRLVLAAAIGRVVFAAASLLAVHVGGAPVLVVFAVLSSLAAVGVELRARRGVHPGRSPDASRPASIAAAALAVAAAVLLVHAVVGRSGLADASGALVFQGRDSTNDPLVYGAVARQLAETGLPLTMPFAGNWPAPGSYGHYAVEAGLHRLSGLSTLALSFRVIPYSDAAWLALSGVALARALGGGAVAAAAAGVLLVLGSGASFLLAPLAAVFGGSVRSLESWALFGPYLAAFNPGAAGLHAWLAAALLLTGRRRHPAATGPPAPAAADAPPSNGGSASAPSARAAPPRSLSSAAAVLAGLLVASLFEWKVFLWAPALAALLVVAVGMPPGARAGRWRLAGAVGLLASLPSLLDRLVGSQAGGGDDTGLAVCVACMPRYLADAAWGSGDVSFALFRDAAQGPSELPVLAASAVAVAVLALGARLIGVVALWRGARGDGCEAGVHRWIGLSAAVGLGGAFVLVTPPHYLNGVQLAWAATFGLWIHVGLQVGAWSRARRFVPAMLALALALPGSHLVLDRLGYRAPVWMRVSAEERALFGELARLAGPRDVVLEPSMLIDTDRPSPLPALQGVPVHLSLLSAVQSLPDAERERRFARLLAVFVGSDAEAARRAVAESGARFVYAPAGWRLPFASAPWLEPVLRSPAGRVFRVRGVDGDEPPGEVAPAVGARDAPGARAARPERPTRAGPP